MDNERLNEYDFTDEAVDEILEEVKSFGEREKADKRQGLPGDFSDEIFSTADKRVKVQTTNPLDVHDGTTGEILLKRLREQDSKTQETMNASRLMEIGDEYEESAEDFLNPDNTVTYTLHRKESEFFSAPELEREELNDQAAASENIDVPDFDGADSAASSGVASYEAQEHAELISVAGSSFSQSVRDEYDEYMSVIIEEKEKELEQLNERERKRKKSAKPAKSANSGNVASKLSSFFSTGEDDEIDRDGNTYAEEEQEGEQEESAEEPINDYRTKDDESSIFEELKFRIHSTSFKTAFLFLLALCSVILLAVQRVSGAELLNSMQTAPIVFAVINAALTAIGIITGLSTVTNGLTPLARFKGNSDTAVAAAGVLCTLQAVAGLFYAEDFFSGKYSFYTCAMLIALFANSWGKNVMVKRINENFKFITSKRTNFAVEIDDDEDLSREMASGTPAAGPVIAYQNQAEMLTDFLKLSYAQDKCEVICSKLAPVTVLCSVLLGILYGVLNMTLMGGICAAAVLSVISVPFEDLLVVNLPLRRFGKELAHKQAMMSGYPAVMRFCKVNAVTVDASDLYVKDGVRAVSYKSFENRFEELAVNYAAAALTEAHSPQATAFNKIKSRYSISDSVRVDSFVYEEGLGIVAWVNNDRVIIGSAELMEKYGIAVPPSVFDIPKKGRTYLSFVAYAGELAAAVELEYKPSKAIKNEMKRAELNGISILVSSTDCNLTQEKLASDFEVYYRSIKVLSSGHTAIARDKTSKVRKEAKALLATKGGAASLLRALSGCSRLKSAFTVGIVLQVVSVILGLILVATLCLFASVSYITTATVLIYSAFWFIAVLIAQRIHKP